MWAERGGQPRSSKTTRIARKRTLDPLNGRLSEGSTTAWLEARNPHKRELPPFSPRSPFFTEEAGLDSSPGPLSPLRHSSNTEAENRRSSSCGWMTIRSECRSGATIWTVIGYKCREHQTQLNMQITLHDVLIVIDMQNDF